MPGGAISCTQALPTNLQSMFEAKRPTIIPIAPDKPRMTPYHGMAAFVQYFTPHAAEPVQVKSEIPAERRARLAKKRKTDAATKCDEAAALYKPHENEDATTDAFKTLFVGRLSYDIDEKKLKYEMERYGPVKKMRIVADSESGKPRGYAFVEFEAESDMKRAYKQCDGMKIEGRRIVVDVERGRTVKNWRPRSLGGGLGGTRIGGRNVNKTFSGREPFAGSSGGGGSSRMGGSPRESDRRDRPRESDRRPRESERSRDEPRRSESDRPRDRDRDRGRDRRDDKPRDRDRDRDRESGRDRDRGRDRERDRDRDNK